MGLVGQCDSANSAGRGVQCSVCGGMVPNGWVGCHLSFGGLSWLGFSLVFRAWPEMPNIDLNQLIRAVVAGITPSNLINFNARLHTQITHMSTHSHTLAHRHTHTNADRHSPCDSRGHFGNILVSRSTTKIYIEVELCNLLLN